MNKIIAQHYQVLNFKVLNFISKTIGPFMTKYDDISTFTKTEIFTKYVEDMSPGSMGKNVDIYNHCDD